MGLQRGLLSREHNLYWPPEGAISHHFQLKPFGDCSALTNQLFNPSFRDFKILELMADD